MVVVLEASSPSPSLCLAEAVAACAAPWSLRGGVGMRFLTILLREVFLSDLCAFGNAMLQLVYRFWWWFLFRDIRQ
jgi:hypothetical protein